MTTKMLNSTTSACVALLMSLAVTAGNAEAADFYLEAAATTKTLPAPGGGTVNVAMWGFVLRDSNFDPLPGEVVSVPGPRLVVPSGDSTVTIHLKNSLPSVPVSIMIPGQASTMTPVFMADPDGTGRPRVRSFTHETAAMGGTAVYSWSNFKSGTFLYQSATHPAVQIQMGLYGAITRDAGAGEVYSGVTYDEEVVLLYSEIDPALHAAVDGGTYVSFGDPNDPSIMTSTIDYRPKYFLINGDPYPNGTTSAQVSAGDRVLVRFLNAGLRTVAPNLLGRYMSVLAEDGNPYAYAKEQYSLELNAGKTRDAIVTIPGGAASGTKYPVYDRRLNLTNAGSWTPGAAWAPGGMLTYLEVVP